MYKRILNTERDLQSWRKLLNRTSLIPAFVLEIDRYSVHTGKINTRFPTLRLYLNFSIYTGFYFIQGSVQRDFTVQFLILPCQFYFIFVKYCFSSFAMIFIILPKKMAVVLCYGAVVVVIIII